jgi:hypothetical protein
LFGEKHYNNNRQDRPELLQASFTLGY